MTVLNIGCEVPRHYMPKGEVVNLDIWKPYLLGKKNSILADCRHLPFKDKSFDVVIAVEVIEHLEFEEGKKLVRDMENLAKSLVIFSTPKFFFTQGNLDENPYQEHKSFYAREQFADYTHVILDIQQVFYKKLDGENKVVTGKSIQEILDFLIY